MIQISMKSVRFYVLPWKLKKNTIGEKLRTKIGEFISIPGELNYTV